MRIRDTSPRYESAVLGDEMRVLDFGELSRAARRGGLVRAQVYVNLLCRASNMRERSDNLLTAP